MSYHSTNSIAWRTPVSYHNTNSIVWRRHLSPMINEAVNKLSKQKNGMDIAIQLGYHIIQLAKLRMLQFKYDFLDVFCLDKSIEYKEMDTYSAYLDSAKYTWKHHLQRHQRTTHGGESHVCQECGDAFKRKDKLSRHIQSMHTNVEYKCDICNKGFSRKDKLQQHQKICMKTHSSPGTTHFVKEPHIS